MREVITMWRHTKMVVLVALTAAVYAAILIPLKGIPLIPGFTEIRPANVVPVVFSLLFGPAGAWGSAFGNLIGDFFGTLGLGSIFGFVGNFFYGLVPYKLWGKVGSEHAPQPLSGRQFLRLLVVTILPSLIAISFVLSDFVMGALGLPLVWVPGLLLLHGVIVATLILIIFIRLGLPLPKFIVPICLLSASPLLMVVLIGWTHPNPIVVGGIIVVGYSTQFVSMLVLLGPEIRKLFARLFVRFFMPAFLASVACAAFISWGVDLFGLVPFGVLAPIITLNNFIAAALLGPFLLWLMYPRAKRWDILWTEIMEPGEISHATRPWIGCVLMWVGGMGALILGVAISTGLYAALPFQFGTGTTGLGVVAGVLPFLVLFVLGCFLA